MKTKNYGKDFRKKKSQGRPSKTSKKEIRAAIRFSKTEYFIIKEKATKAGVKPSSFFDRLPLMRL
jgi:predicted DNA binding CopG/RHH family protein